jgi:hypothetical protein
MPGSVYVACPSAEGHGSGRHKHGRDDAEPPADAHVAGAAQLFTLFATLEKPNSKNRPVFGVFALFANWVFANRVKP